MDSNVVRNPARPVGRLFLTTLVLILLLPGTIASAASPPDFKLKDVDGNWFTLSEHLGDEVIYLSFWATWCVPCRRELPHLQEMSEEFGDEGFLVVGIDTDPAKAKSKIKPYLRRHRITFLTVLDPDNTVLDKYNPTRELPYGVLIDREGNVHEIYAGYRTGDEIRLRKAVESLLATDANDEELSAGE